MKGEMNLAS